MKCLNLVISEIPPFKDESVNKGANLQVEPKLLQEMDKSVLLHEPKFESFSLKLPKIEIKEESVDKDADLLVGLKVLQVMDESILKKEPKIEAKSETKPAKIESKRELCEKDTGLEAKQYFQVKKEPLSYNEYLETKENLKDSIFSLEQSQKILC